MTSAHRLTWLPMMASAAILVSMLVFLYGKTRSFNEMEYFEQVVLFRYLKQLDAQWELDVMKSRVGLNTYYDPLADSLGELNRLVERVETGLRGSHHEQAGLLMQNAALLRDAIREKSALVEQFKSDNALLRNSLAFLPTAAEDVRRAAVRAGDGEDPGSTRVLSSINSLLLQSMLYSQNASGEKKAEIEAALDRLGARREALPADARAALQLFERHVRVILLEQRKVDNLVSRIAAVPTGVRIDALDGMLGGEQQSAAVRNRQTRQYLLVFSAILVLLLFYLAGRLVHSNSVIDRVNRKLVTLNENLEDRVRERTDELRDAQAQLMAAARRSGMAEIANNVLHNVGNVLNSINVSAGLASERLRASRVRGLDRAVRLMDEHAGDLGEFLTQDAKGRLVPGYLRELARTLESEHDAIAQELATLGESVDHIKVVVATQQAHAGSPGVIESSRPSDLVEDALRMNAAALARGKVAVVRQFDDLPALPLDRHRVLQILMNLISNARQAIVGSGPGNASITLCSSLVDGGVLRLSVADSGEGIAPENLARIFSHGFTTRKDGHGFGLHSCVLAAQEMGGSLTARSEGRGKGAVFTLDIPVGSHGELQ